METPKIGAAVLVLAVLSLSACSKNSPASAPAPVPAAERITFRTTKGPIEPAGPLPVASTDAARAQGLMGRTSLAADGGMIFAFSEPTRTTFWMKDTRIPLSIAFWDSGGKIIGILDMQPCTTDPCPAYAPRSDYVGAVEMNQGWFTKNGVRIGDQVQLG
jgi:uncharacterized membrane protein (UPF0127 family)